MWKRLIGIIGAALIAAGMATGSALAETKREKADKLVAKAADTVAYFANDTAFEPLWDLADDAKAFVVIPRSLRGGFIFGASGGNAVMIARKDDGAWSEPVFMTVGSLSFGFQAGLEGSEIVLAVMTQRGVENILSTSVKLGGDLTVAAGPIGAGAKAQTADILAFSRSRGLYGGISLEGAVLKARHSWNRGYYGEDVRPIDVIFLNKVSRPNSAVLQNAVWALAHRDQRREGPAALVAPVQPAAVDPVTGEPISQPIDPVTGLPIEADQYEYEDDAVYAAPLGPVDEQ